MIYSYHPNFFCEIFEFFVTNPMIIFFSKIQKIFQLFFGNHHISISGSNGQQKIYKFFSPLILR
jgi:hypothetical protein